MAGHGAITGVKELEEEIAAIAAKAADALRDARVIARVHDELLSQMNAASIPIDTGALAASLRDAGNSEHVFETVDGAIVFGSTNPAAVYNPRLVPVVDVDAVADVIAEEMSRDN